MKNEENKHPKTSTEKELDILNEIKKLSEEAMNDTAMQSEIFPLIDIDDSEDINVDDIDFSKISQEADPDKSHKLYYGIQNLLKANLPQGKKNKKLRSIIYDEKNLFLKAGKTIGADSRQAYIRNFLDEALLITKKWIESGSNPFDIYISFRNLNIERGYRSKG